MSLSISQAATRVDTHTNTHALASDHQKNAGIVIIGAGMAGSRFAIELARTQSNNDKSRLPITLISKEPHVGYNRIMLSPVLAGDTAFEDTYLYDNSEYEQLGITVLSGVAVETIDTRHQCIELDDGQTLNYAKVVMATGSTARVIPFPNHTAKGVHVFRDLADVTALMDYARQGKTGLVIGGGVLGLEAACALAAQGASMTVIHMDGYVLNRQLDLSAAELLQAELSRRGVGLAVSAHTEAIEMNDAGEVCGLSLKDGRMLAADFIVMAVGVIPNTALAKQSGLEVNRGIVVDDFMHTSCPNVYAIGECIEREGELFGMVAPVNQQVDTLVTVLKDDLIESDINVIGNKAAVPDHWVPFVSKPLSLKLKVSGMSAFSAGQIAFDDEVADTIETLVYRQPELDHYHCLYLKENKLIGAVLYGDTSDGSFYSQLIIDNVDITSIKDTLIFGEAYCHLDEITLNNLPTTEVDIEFNETDKNVDHHKAAELLEDAL
ncbi:NAD(P)/FAD-dependent oxidoreductase [Psychrobacter sp. MES7-P7E]|uniref:NAD(P)/FAD-dependent oxidoreductase n=1 Tax=Psychrobacter sp. MES7-P7E TaxID=2058322 RepID=UPI000C7EF90D|nr:FAD-dependent oxidoreductase [Psychrobacter sp. MES7-P7E]PLT21562.1 NAD(P)/FAD-dependent oxidoreductase [Psychrobacter sp. MES7-P7E]